MDHPNNIQEDLRGLEDEYEILAELGRGGSSVVYLARDLVLDREVAVKVTRHAHLADDEVVARLEREARSLARLVHPNIVTLYSAKRLPGGSLALIMQHGRWKTLKTLVREAGPLPHDRARRILCDIASALAYIHDRGVVHRDVKPENIFVEDGSDRALLSDFGIAKPGDGQANITLTGVVIGTPAYMSPEQVDGGAVDGKSDLYSLGMVGYEMLTGKRPWEGESLYSVIFKQKTESPPALRSVRPDVPDDLCSAIERAIAKDRDARWPGVAAFLASLSGPGPESVPAPPVRVDDAPAEAPPEELHTVELARIIEEMAAPPRPRARLGKKRTLAALVTVLVLGGGVSAAGIGLSRGSYPGSQPSPAMREASGTALLAGGTALRDGAVSGAERREPQEARLDAVVADPGATPSPDPGARAAPPAAPASPPVHAAAPRPEPGAVRQQRPARAAAERPAPADQNPARQEPAILLVAPSVVSAPRILTPSLEPVLPAAEVAEDAGDSAPAPSSAGPPKLLNRDFVVRAMAAEYTDRARKSGVSGTTVVAILVTSTGQVVDTRVEVSSGHPQLDSAAVQGARLMRFSGVAGTDGARQRWITLPLTFSKGRVSQ